MAITTSCFEGRFASARGFGSGSLSIADHSCSISAARSPTLRLLSTPGQRVPQCQKPLAVERGGQQFLFRRNDHLAVIDCGWRFAAQRDAVIADDVGAHGWVLLVGSTARCRR